MLVPNTCLPKEKQGLQQCKCGSVQCCGAALYKPAQSAVFRASEHTLAYSTKTTTTTKTHNNLRNFDPKSLYLGFGKIPNDTSNVWIISTRTSDHIVSFLIPEPDGMKFNKWSKRQGMSINSRNIDPALHLNYVFKINQNGRTEAVGPLAEGIFHPYTYNTPNFEFIPWFASFLCQPSVASVALSINSLPAEKADWIARKVDEHGKRQYATVPRVSTLKDFVYDSFKREVEAHKA
ncbi:hypothetical protein DFH11DRAFT_1745507 [Phellopilus nigrolimitatus]|nr:hypothetical protein DFH11DRAFT_1745507 [Phellopilus nigrolimitatus]